MTKPPFTWLGGKQKHLTWILSHFPPPSKTTEQLFDCCGGSGAIALNAPKYRQIFYNDLYGEAVNFFRTLRNPECRDELILQCLLTPFSREELKTAQEKNHPCPIERARRFYARCQQSFGGQENLGQWKVSRASTKRCPPDIYNNTIRLPEIAKMISEWNIENMDVFKLIDKYDDPVTLFYIDPPYPDLVRAKGQPITKQYKHDASSPEWHKRLAERLKTIDGKAIVSCYASDEYASWFEGFRRVNGEPYMSFKNKKPRQEMILLNFEEHEQPQPKLI